MTDAQFWDHIRAARAADPDEHVENLTDRLVALPVADILAFGRRWVELQGRASTREMLGAAYLVNGGGDADDFPEFLDWLILQGEAAYSSAVTNPDALTDVVEDATECEVDTSPAYEAYCLVTEQDDYTDALLKQFPELVAVTDGPGSGWPFTATEFRARLPRLAARFLADA